MNIPDRNTNNDTNRQTQRCVIIRLKCLIPELSRDRFKIRIKLNTYMFNIRQIIEKSDKIIVKTFKI
jgi:hypothetical protein